MAPCNAFPLRGLHEGVHQSKILLVLEDRPSFLGLMLLGMALAMLFGGMVMMREGLVRGGAGPSSRSSAAVSRS
jgi:hypothetical protein